MISDFNDLEIFQINKFWIIQAINVEFNKKVEISGKKSFGHFRAVRIFDGTVMRPVIQKTQDFNI